MALSFLVMLTPLQLPGVFIVHLIVLFLTVIALWHYPADALLLSVFGIAMIFLTALSLLIDQENSIGRDYFELVKYIAVFLAILVGASVTPSRTMLGYLWRFFCLVTYALCALGLIQTLGWDSSFPLLADLVRDKADLGGKAITFFWTTYFAATAYCFLAAFFLGCLANGYKNNFLTHTSICMLFGLTLLTQSRSAFFALVILVFVYVIICCKRSSLFSIFLFISTIALSVCVSNGLLNMQGFNLRYLMKGLDRYFLNWSDNIGGSNSLSIRFSEIIQSSELNFMVLTGVGIGKGTLGAVESWIALYYYRYGLTGMALYAAFWVLPVVMSILALFRPHSGEQNGGRSVLYGMAMFSLVLPFLSLSSVMTDQAHFVGPMYVFAGLAYAQYRAIAIAPHFSKLSGMPASGAA